MKTTKLFCFAAFALANPSAHAALTVYDGTESGTLHLWQFNEADNTPTSTAATTGGVALNKANGATLGNAGFTGFGNAGNTSAGSNSDFLSTNVYAVSTVTGTGGAFTFEAMINVSTITVAQQVFSMEGENSTARPFQFRIGANTLDFINIAGGGSPAAAAIPTVGADAWVANQWFHIAVTYTGDASATGNFSYYWTRVDASRTEANLIATSTMTADLAGSARYGVGNDARTSGGQDKNIEGLIDEVRVSGVARGAGDFIFAIPEPSTALLGGLGALLLLRRRR